MEQPRSEPVNWVGVKHLGFVINAAFSEDNKTVLADWLDGLYTLVPEGIYPMQAEGLHVTVLDWVAPLFDYDGVNKRELYEKLYPSYNIAFRQITNETQSFDVHFNEIRVTPGAIILVGQDTGQFQSLRTSFINSVALPEGGKRPPEIVHSSLARFVAPVIELSPVEAYAAEHPIDITQHISEFRLVETRRDPMQDFTVLDTYKLAN